MTSSLRNCLLSLRFFAIHADRNFCISTGCSAIAESISLSVISGRNESTAFIQVSSLSPLRNERSKYLALKLNVFIFLALALKPWNLGSIHGRLIVLGITPLLIKNGWSLSLGIGKYRFPSPFFSAELPHRH